MTIGDLIERLRHFNPDWGVLVDDDRHGYLDIEGIWLVDASGRLATTDNATGVVLSWHGQE